MVLCEYSLKGAGETPEALKEERAGASTCPADGSRDRGALLAPTWGSGWTTLNCNPCPVQTPNTSHKSCHGSQMQSQASHPPSSGTRTQRGWCVEVQTSPFCAYSTVGAGQGSAMLTYIRIIHAYRCFQPHSSRAQLQQDNLGDRTGTGRNPIRLWIQRPH